MAKNVDEEPSSVSECPVCWNAFDNVFRTPKLLRCGHSFCIECLAHLSLIAAAQNQLPCPLCRCLTLLPANQKVTELPTNVPLLHKLGLEPKHVILEGRQLCLKEKRKIRYFLRQPRVYTLDLGLDPELGTQPYSESPQPATVANTPTVPRRALLRECIRNPHLRIFTYLMVIILSVTLLLVFSVFWTKNYFPGLG
ncbi:probable E3 ubiquitin-protein ligase RNF183 [Pseudonaja textilis]|uniref:probable E3 ubiquitin-protein ligase RNF183 n=1 Tax=Pseudonaja textilis TaxID=8673 RepID=UPI000EA8C327|nr:probable E3 ubiquitin-protein ligase RNF183 [Pseudonaja textilis]